MSRTTGKSLETLAFAYKQQNTGVFSCSNLNRNRKREPSTSCIFAKHLQDTTVLTAARTAGAVAVCKEKGAEKRCVSGGGAARTSKVR